MPYVKKEQRISMNTEIKDIPLGGAGNLNYTLTTICQYYLKLHGLKYATINDIVGALEGAKIEFYRRVATPYEEEKIMQNGDVY